MTSAAVPIRDARYAQPDYSVAHRADGSILIANRAIPERPFQTTHGPLDHWAEAAPSRVWLAERSGRGWRTITYSEARDAVASLAGGLAGLGLGPGRPLLILARNGIDHALIAYAAMRIGAPIAPVSPQYGLNGADPARFAHAVALIGPGCVFVDDPMLFATGLETPGLAGVAVVAGANARPGDQAFSDLLGKGSAIPDMARPDQCAKLLLTSGSTGMPKAVVGAHGNISVNAAQIAACFDDPDPPIVVNSAPWSHSLGANSILHFVLSRGGTHYIDAGQPVPGRFGETLRNLREVSTTYCNMVPAGWGLLAAELEQDPALAKTFFAQVRLLQYGGAGLAQSIADRIQAVAVRTIGERLTFGTGYGSTETGPTICNIHWPNLRTGMIGMPIPGTTIKLAPEDDKFEIRAQGPQISPGYYDARNLDGPEPAGLSFDDEGFFRLGDAARLVDAARPERGMVFDGRLVENFKLATGAFVTAGALRISALSAIGAAVLDTVVCGEGHDGVGLLVFANPAVRQRLGETALRREIQSGLERLNSGAKGVGGKVIRALILPDGPDARSGEMTEKGYINQALARSRRSRELDRLFALEPDREVIVLG